MKCVIFFETSFRMRYLYAQKRPGSHGTTRHVPKCPRHFCGRPEAFCVRVPRLSIAVQLKTPTYGRLTGQVEPVRLYTIENPSEH